MLFGFDLGGSPLKTCESDKLDVAVHACNLAMKGFGCMRPWEGRKGERERGRETGSISAGRSGGGEWRVKSKRCVTGMCSMAGHSHMLGKLAKCHRRAQAAPALHVLVADARLAEETGDAQ